MQRVRQIAATGIDGIYVDIPYWMTHFEGWENTWASFDDGTVEAFREKTGLDTKKDLKLGDSLPIWQVPPSFCALRPAITSTAMYLWLMVVGYPAERRLVKAQPRDTPNCTSNRHSPRHGQARKKAHEYCRSVRAKLNRHHCKSIYRLQTVQSFRTE